MKAFAFLLLLASLQICVGQTDTNLLATGDWSEIVGTGLSNLRGRLLVYDDQAPSARNHARVYLELQHVEQGGWDFPVKIYYEVGKTLSIEMRDGLGHSLPSNLFFFSRVAPTPCWVVLPCDATVRLRADESTLGSDKKPDGLEILVWPGLWMVRADATNDYYLSATLNATSPSSDPPGNPFSAGAPVPAAGSPAAFDPQIPRVWQGTLKLPAVKIPLPVKKP
jgi:hypothetical protein